MKKIVIMAVKKYEWREDEGESFSDFIGRTRKKVVKRLRTDDIYLKVV